MLWNVTIVYETDHFWSTFYSHKQVQQSSSLPKISDCESYVPGVMAQRPSVHFGYGTAGPLCDAPTTQVHAPTPSHGSNRIHNLRNPAFELHWCATAQEAWDHYILSLSAKAEVPLGRLGARARFRLRPTLCRCVFLWFCRSISRHNVFTKIQGPIHVGLWRRYITTSRYTEPQVINHNWTTTAVLRNQEECIPYWNISWKLISITSKFARSLVTMIGVWS